MKNKYNYVYLYLLYILIFLSKDLKILLDKVGEKVRKLIISHNHLLKKNEDLINQKELLVKEIGTLKENVRNLNSRLNDVSVSKSFETAQTDNQLAKKKVNMFLREIDKCIALLNN